MGKNKGRNDGERQSFKNVILNLLLKYERKRRYAAMKEFNYVITDEIGIHARPAGQLVKEAKAFTSKITLETNGKSADASKLMAVMSLGVKCGTEVTVKAEGEDEDAAIAKLQEFMKINL